MIRDLVVALVSGVAAGAAVSVPIFIASARQTEQLAERQDRLEQERAERQDVLENVRFVRDRAADPVGGRPFSGLNLQGASLRGLRLDCSEDQPEAEDRCANFNRADLTRADLTRSNLIGANFDGAELRSATLVGAGLHRASFTFVEPCSRELLRGAPQPRAVRRCGSPLRELQRRDPHRRVHEQPVPARYGWPDDHP